VKLTSSSKATTGSSGWADTEVDAVDETDGARKAGCDAGRDGAGVDFAHGFLNAETVA
jgi:hypothetical protein